MLDEMDFRNYTREEVIEILVDLKNPNLEPLIKWISESFVLGDSYRSIRVVLATAKRQVELTVKEPNAPPT